MNKGARVLFLTLTLIALSVRPGAAEQTLNLGALLTLSGPGAAWGQGMLHAAELAAEDENRQGGLQVGVGADACRPCRPCRPRECRALHQPVGDQELVGEVALEVDPPPVEDDRAQRRYEGVTGIGGDRRPRQRGHPPVDLGPRQRARCLPVAVGDQPVGVAQIDADVTEPRPTGGDGQAQERLVLEAREGTGECGAQLQLSSPEDAGVGERRQEPESGWRGGAGHRTTSVVGWPSSRSLSSPTSAVGTRQPNTPSGWPSWTGVSGPAIPRTKR